MKPLEAFYKLIDKITLLDKWRNKGPGKVVESMSPEAREALANLKSGEIAPDLVRPKDYEMMGSNYFTTDPSNRVNLLEFEKQIGIKPPPRKKYEEYDK